jgi:hypothetical protein
LWRWCGQVGGVESGHPRAKKCGARIGDAHTAALGQGVSCFIGRNFADTTAAQLADGRYKMRYKTPVDCQKIVSDFNV